MEISEHADTRIPIRCSRCNWLGIRVQGDDDFACPVCTGPVNSMQQKGLDSLRTQYRLLSKMGYASHLTREQREAEQTRLELFFESLGHPF